MQTYEPSVFANLAESELGRRLWRFLNQDDSIIRMETATELGRPAVEGLEKPLLEAFGEAVLDDRVKQMIGHMVRQIMESQGFVHEMKNVKITSGAPFSRASRYAIPGNATFFVFQDSTDPRSLALTDDRHGDRLPTLPGRARWIPWKSFRGGVRGRIAFGLDDEARASSEIKEHGYYRYRLDRILRAK